MKEFIIKISTFILIFAFAASLFSVPVSADKSGSCGENDVSFTYSSSKKRLIISGTGAMVFNKAPWKNNLNVKSIVIKDGITAIPSYAFNGTTQKLVIADSVVKIEQNAMSGLTVKGKITLPDNLEYLGSCSLPSCKNKTLYIPASVKTIEKDTFWNNGYKEFVVDKANTNYKSVSGIIYDKKVTEMVAFPYKRASKTYKAPKTLLRVDSGIIRSLHLRKIYLNKNMDFFGKFYVYTGFKKSKLSLYVYSKKTRLSKEIKKKKSWGENSKLTIYKKYNNTKKTYYTKGVYVI